MDMTRAEVDALAARYGHTAAQEYLEKYAVRVVEGRRTRPLQAPRPTRFRDAIRFWPVSILLTSLVLISLIAAFAGQLDVATGVLSLWFVLSLIYGIAIVIIGLKFEAQSPKTNPSSISAWRDAEHFVESWLRSRGELDVRVGRGTADGGVDVESRRYVVQVKHWSGNVGAPAVRQIFGVATARGKQAAIVAKSGFTREAIAFAREAGVELWTYRSGSVERL